MLSYPHNYKNRKQFLNEDMTSARNDNYYQRVQSTNIGYECTINATFMNDKLNFQHYNWRKFKRHIDYICQISCLTKLRRISFAHNPLSQQQDPLRNKHFNINKEQSMS